MDQLRHLIREMHRRSLWQVLTIYLLGAWLGYEAIVALYEGLGLPDWVPALAVVLFIIGLPIVLATAFVQEGLPGESPSSSGDDAAIPVHDLGSDPGAGPLPTAGGTSPSGGADSGAENAPDQPSPSGPWLLTWSRSITALVLAFALLGLAAAGFLGARALGIGPMGTLVSRGELEARAPLVVADFTPLTGDTSLATVVTEGLRADLAQSSFVTVADRAEVRATMERMIRDPNDRLDPATAREVAVRQGHKAVVEGEVGRAGAGYLLTARVVTADSGRTLATFRETAGDSTEILAAIEGLSRALRERVGESLKAVRESAPLARVTTSSLPALRRAAQAVRAELTLGTLDHRDRAMELMREAIALDPGFAWAWLWLAAMHYNNGDLSGALQAVGAALEHENRLSEFRRHEAGSMYASITGDLATAARALDAWIARDSTNPRPYVRASDVAWNRGRWDEAARHARRAIELESGNNWVSHFNRVIALVDGGRVEEARRAAVEAESMLGPGWWNAHLPFMIWATTARYDSIHEKSVELGFERDASKADRVVGRWTEARRHLNETFTRADYREDYFDALGRWDRLMVLNDSSAGDSLFAYFEARSADPRDGSGAGNGLLVSSYDLSQRSPIAALAVGFAAAGRIDDARRVRDYYLAVVPEPVRWRDAHLLSAVEGFIALHGDRPEDALSALREARRQTPWTAPVDALLGRAYDILGRPDSAIAAYTRYIETPWSFRIWDPLLGDAVLLVPTHLRLALLHEDLGNLDAAARHAAEVVRLWDDADPVLQDRVRAMRRILGRMAGEG